VNGDVRGRLWPVYVVADESGSMYPYMDELNAGLDSIRRELLAEPMAAAKVRLTVIGFSDDAVVRMHLVDARHDGEFARLASRGGTNYGAAFDTLRRLVPEDVATLKSQQYAVYRPAVFFLSDGMPNDGADWPAAHRSLTDRAVTRAAPNIIACGIGEARADIIRQVATRPQYAFVAVPGSEVGRNISEFFTALTRSVVASTRTENLIVEPPAGFTVLLDEV